jgi:hypothetical protein
MGWGPSSFQKLIVGMKLQQLDKYKQRARRERRFCGDQRVGGLRRQHPAWDLETATREVFDGHRAI